MATSAFKQTFMFHRFCPIKRKFSPERNQCLAQAFNCSSQTYLHNNKSVCAVFHPKQTLKVFVICWK